MVAWLSHVGHFRSRNEDRFLAKTVWDGAYLLLLVADGAGGHEAGDAAATASVETFDELFPVDGAAPTEGEPRIWLHDTILTAHDRVVDLATSRIRPPASTLVGVLVEQASLRAWRFHVGDSRLYVRGLNGMVSQWTRDHNITNGLIDRGLSVDQAMRIADGGRLTQVVGGTSDISPEIHGPLALEPGQVLLLCSDGVYGHNDDPEILPASMVPDMPASVQLQGLQQGVLSGDAPDNLTAILWQIDSDLAAPAVREVVTNSMPAVSAEAIQLYIEQRELAQAESTGDEEHPTDPRLLPEDAPTMDAMDAHVPGTTDPDEEEDTLNTSPVDALRDVSAVDRTQEAVEAMAGEARQAVDDSTRDTRSALLLVLGLIVVLVATYTTVISQMRGELPAVPASAVVPPQSRAALPAEDAAPASVEPELPGESESASEAEVELPGEPNSSAPVEPELPGEADSPSAEELASPEEPVEAEDELPGEPNVDGGEDVELPDSTPAAEETLVGDPE